jgi:mannan endo-1,4-beta-mannosidase
MQASLTDSGNTVLFRPFIELNGNWNWYGAENPADFIAVWQDMYHYLMVTKGLKNVLWIYNVNPNVGSYTAYYPGASYVDIVGLDIYGTSSQFVQYGNAGNAYSDLASLGKPLILPEVGLGINAPANDTVDDTTIIDDIKKSFPDFVAFVVFNGSFAICNQDNASALMNDPWVVDLAGVPSGL